MSQAVALVADALRHKLARDGISSLTPVEWHLLHVSQFLNAIEEDRLRRMLTDTPIAELVALAGGLDAIQAPDASAAIHEAVAGLMAANVPGNAANRNKAVRDISTALASAVNDERERIERQLLDYAFRQPELMTDPAVSP
jgi:hypothetical protein